MGLAVLIAQVGSGSLTLYAVLSIVVIFLLKQCVFHPLAGYPGPLLGKFTNLYAAYHAWRGTLHVDMYRCHQRYEISAHHANVTKATAYDALVHGARNVLTLRDKVEHSFRRRILSLALSDSTIASYEAVLKQHILNLCDNIRYSAQVNKDGSGSVSLDMSKQCHYFTFDIMSEVIFGMKYSALREHTHRYVIAALEASNLRISALVQSPFLKSSGLDKYLFPSSLKGRDKFLGFITSLLKDRSKASLSDNDHVFAFLENAKDTVSGRSLDKAQIRAECATLVVAGSDTSSLTLAGTLFYLSSNSQARERASREVRDKFASLESIRLGPELNSCIYLRACIDETLRMSPPVGGALWREVGPGGMVIDSVRVPAGIDVGTGIYSLHHHEDYHAEPFTYRPERWLVGEGTSTKQSVERSRSAFIPFSSGPRSCVGKGFAYHEIGLALAHILYLYDFEETPESLEVNQRMGGRDGEYLLKDHLTGAREGPLLRFALCEDS